MRPGKPRSAAVLAVVLGAIAAMSPTPALAGAPAFECVVGSTRIGLDTHRSTALVRQPFGPVARFRLTRVEADGVNQRYRLTSGSSSRFVDVRGAGSTLLTDITGVRSVGGCAFVPGDFALGTVNSSRVSLRVAPSSDAAIAAVLHRGSLVWLDPSGTSGDRHATDLVRVRVFLRVRGGRFDGGEQQLGMGAAFGMDGRSTVLEGWVRKQGIEWVGPAGP